MKNKWVVVAIAIFLIAAGFGAYLYYDHASKYPFEKASTVTIGWIGPLTGPVSVLGIDNLNAVRLALKNYEQNKSANDPDIDLKVVDDKYVPGNLIPRTTIAAYKKMAAEDHPEAIFLLMYSGVDALAADALKDDVILIDPIDNDRYLTSLNHNVFLIAKETEGLAAVDAEAIIAQGKKNAFVIYYIGDNFMPALAKKIEDILKSYGAKATLVGYTDGTTDFRPFLEQGKRDGADSYVFFGYQEIGFAMKQAREIGITAPFYAVNVVTDPQLQANANGALDETYFAHFTAMDGNPVLADEFIRKYFNEYGQAPILDWTAMQGYDAANILINSIKNAARQEGNFTDNLRRELLQTNNFEGVSGNINILPSGTSRGIYPSLYIMKENKSVPYIQNK